MTHTLKHQEVQGQLQELGLCGGTELEESTSDILKEWTTLGPTNPASMHGRSPLKEAHAQGGQGKQRMVCRAGKVHSSLRLKNPRAGWDS